MKPEPKFIRMCEAPEMFGVTDDTLRKWAKDDGFKLYKIGGASLLKVADVEAFIESNAVQSGG